MLNISDPDLNQDPASLRCCCHKQSLNYSLSDLARLCMPIEFETLPLYLHMARRSGLLG